MFIISPSITASIIPNPFRHWPKRPSLTQSHKNSSISESQNIRSTIIIDVDNESGMFRHAPSAAIMEHSSHIHGLFKLHIALVESDVQTGAGKADNIGQTIAINVGEGSRILLAPNGGAKLHGSVFSLFERSVFLVGADKNA